MGVLNEWPEVAFEGCTAFDIESVVIDPGVNRDQPLIYLFPDRSWILTAVVPICALVASGSSTEAYLAALLFIASCIASLASSRISSRKTTVPLRVDMPVTRPGISQHKQPLTESDVLDLARTLFTHELESLEDLLEMQDLLTSAHDYVLVEFVLLILFVGAGEISGKVYGSTI
jgi:hypothetical protein